MKSICSTVASPSCCPAPSGSGERINYPDLGCCSLCPSHAYEAVLTVDLSTPTTVFCPWSPPGNMINMVSAIRTLETLPLRRQGPACIATSIPDAMCASDYLSFIFSHLKITFLYLFVWFVCARTWHSIRGRSRDKLGGFWSLLPVCIPGTEFVTRLASNCPNRLGCSTSPSGL